jgi:Insulinase (Peptidase family M16)
VKQLEVEIENMGGSLNAYTGREQTCYYAKVSSPWHILLGGRGVAQDTDAPALSWQRMFPCTWRAPPPLALWHSLLLQVDSLLALCCCARVGNEEGCGQGTVHLG